jgi:hypothetical protein
MSDEDNELEKWRKEHGIVDEEMQRLTSPELRMIHLIEKLSQRVDENAEATRGRTDEMQRNIDFIVQHQAQFAADMQQLRESQTRSEQKWERTAEGINALLAIAELHDSEIKSLAEAQAKAQARTDKQMVETDERLNALVNVVERLISERRNGGSSAS